jgi:hypothetical protein
MMASPPTREPGSRGDGEQSHQRRCPRERGTLGIYCSWPRDPAHRKNRQGFAPAPYQTLSQDKLKYPDGRAMSPVNEHLWEADRHPGRVGQRVDYCGVATPKIEGATRHGLENGVAGGDRAELTTDIVLPFRSLERPVGRPSRFRFISQS